MQNTENKNTARRKRDATLISKRSEMGAVILILVLVFVIGMVNLSSFAMRNMADVLRATGCPLIIAAPLTYLFISGGSDLSVSAVTNLGGIVCDFAMAELKLLTPVTILITLSVGALCGLLKVGIVVRMAPPPFIMTLGLQYVINGFVLVSTNGLPTAGFSNSFKVLGQGKVFGVYWTVIIAVIEDVIIHVMLNRTKFGRQICAVGDNQETTKLAGIDVGKTRTIINVLVSVLAAFCGVCTASRFSSAQTAVIIGTEMTIMSSVIIGGTSMMGGSGTIIGSLSGCLLLVVTNNGPVLMYVSSFWQNLAFGVVLIISITIDKYRREKSGSGMQRRERRLRNMSETVLEMRHVTRRSPGVIALDDVNMGLRKGETLGTCGENGVGKSTLMKVLSGNYSNQEYEGEIVIDGVPQTFEMVATAQKAGTEMVYQKMNMMLDSSVAESLFVGNPPGKNGWVDYKTLYADTQKLSGRVNLDLKPGEPMHPLNNGQIQMLSLMRAATKNPRIPVLDEPITALTDSEVEVMMKLLNELRNSGTSCIYISHKLEEIYRLCDRVLVLRDGHTISCYDAKGVAGATPVEEMVGRKVENLYPKSLHTDGSEEVLRVGYLSVPHPNTQEKYIVEDIFFNLRKGEILGIGGLVGVGRSESLGAISGQYTEHVRKEVYIHGKEVEINNPKDTIAHSIGFVTEERKRNGIIRMPNIREDVSVASLDKVSKGTFTDKKKGTEEVGSLSDKLRVKAPDMDTKLVQFPSGSQQKAILVKWPLNNPQILFMDEPTKGIDVGTKADFYQLMSDLAEQGVSIVTISSDMPEPVPMDNRCIVVSNGHITGELVKDDTNEINMMRAAISE